MPKRKVGHQGIVRGNVDAPRVEPPQSFPGGRKLARIQRSRCEKTRTRFVERLHDSGPGLHDPTGFSLLARGWVREPFPNRVDARHQLFA
jgi:hypothetical protein